MMLKPLPVTPRPEDRWHLLEVSDLAEPLPPVAWVCEGIGLAPGAVSLVAGYGYSRKTMAMQSLAVSVASGKPAWGVWSLKRGPVLHLDYEQGRRLTQERYQRLCRGFGFELGDLPAGSLRVASLPEVYLDSSNVDANLLRLTEGAALVLVDSLRAALPSVDENSSDIRSHLDALSRASERSGAAFCVIHHARKPSANVAVKDGATHSIRGASSIFDACQSVYVFSGEKDKPTIVHHQKDRVRGITLEDFGLISEDVEHDGQTRWGLRVRHLNTEQLASFDDETEKRKSALEEIRASKAILETMRRYAGVWNGSKEDLRTACKINRNAFVRALRSLEEARHLIREGTYHHPTWRLPSVPAPILNGDAS